MQRTFKRPITVSVVSHGQQSLVTPLLLQLEKFSANVIEKVILTSNIPEDEYIVDPSSNLQLQKIQNSTPEGFGANHNAAFCNCQTEWFLVLNPDIRLSHNVLKELLEEATEQTGVVAPRIQEPGKFHPEPHRGLLTPLEIMTRHRTNHQAPRHPAWLPGMFLLFRSESFRQIGGFDEKYHMYGEDFDACARLRLAGWDLQSIESQTVLHQAQRSSHHHWRYMQWHITSLIRLWTSSTFWRYRKLLAAPTSSQSAAERMAANEADRRTPS